MKEKTKEMSESIKEEITQPKISIIKRPLVVPELPKKEIRDTKDDDGNEYEFITYNEALQEILETIRLLKKNLV